MKYYIILFACLLSFGACSEDSLELGDNPLGVDFAINNNSVALVDGINSQIKVEIENMYDSRCPANAICIWEGNYGVDLIVSDATQSQSINLCNLFCGSTYTEKDTVSFNLNDNSYSIVLKDIQPYPGIDENTEPERAILNIFRN